MERKAAVCVDSPLKKFNVANVHLCVLPRSVKSYVTATKSSPVLIRHKKFNFSQESLPTLPMFWVRKITIQLIFRLEIQGNNISFPPCKMSFKKVL